MPFVPGNASFPVIITLAPATVLGVKVTAATSTPPDVTVVVVLIDASPFEKRPTVAVVFAKLIGTPACWVPDIVALIVTVVPAFGAIVEAINVTAAALSVYVLMTADLPEVRVLADAKRYDEEP